MFTDWTMTDPHYFYWRGALWGFVAATLVWTLFAPALKKWIIKKRVESLYRKSKDSQ